MNCFNHVSWETLVGISGTGSSGRVAESLGSAVSAATAETAAASVGPTGLAEG